jgi:predicted phage terminase large subunit-like protein
MSKPLPEEVLAAQKEMAARVLCKRRLIPFTQRINPKYEAGWAHQDIAHRLEKFSEDVVKGLSPRLMLLMPPRAGKSELGSRMFPAWHLGRHPDHEIISCSYNVSLAMSFSRKVKEVLEDPSYQSVFPTRLNPNHQSAEEWGIDGTRGGYVAAGVGGGITGKGCHILLIDDPLKNAEEADSAETREKIWDWYGSTAYTRLSPGGGVLVIQTWWHDDDLAGRLQTAMASDPDADQFEVVKYPAVAEQDEWVDMHTDEIIRIASQAPDFFDPDPASAPLAQAQATENARAQGYDTSCLRFLRPKGQALHPERYDRIKLNRIRKTIPTRFWSALYQQNPVPDDGAYFLKEHFKRGPVPSVSRSNVFIAFDFAISEKKQNDYTVGSVGLQDEDDVLHVAEVMRFRSGDALFIVDSILGLCRRWYSSNLVLGFEDGQIYKTMAVLLKKRMQEERFYPSIAVLQPVTDKMARARPLQGRLQQGMVSFNDTGEWYDVVRQEMLRFPAGAHDDCVDSLAWMTQLCVNRAPPRKPKQKSEKSWKDKLPGAGRNGQGHMAA